jgi:hypothetical protein
MTSKTRLLASLLPCLGFLAFAAESPKSSQTPQQLVELSRKVSDLSGVGPYQLQATVVLNPRTSKEISGAITILRDKGLYHSDLKLSGYRETRWIKEQTLYIVRTQSLPVPTLLLLRELDHLWRAPVIPDGIKTLKQSNEKDHGTQLDCFESNQADWRNKFCFDPATSVLVKAKGLEFHDVELQDFGTFEQKYFPRKIIVQDQGKTVLEIRNISISKAKFTPDMVDPPKNATALPTCDELTPARKIKDVNPEIPFDELRRTPSTIVYMYGLIATDGSVQNISIEYSPSNAFTESARNAFQQWRYKPAMCGDKTVPTEIETHFLYFVR